METKSHTTHSSPHEARARAAFPVDDAHRTALLGDFDEILTTTLELLAKKSRIEEELAMAKELGRRTFERSTWSDVRNRETEMRQEAEDLNSILANLYIAIERVHSSLTREDVLAAIEEVIVNQIGSEEFAIFERERDDEPLALASFFGSVGGRMPHEQVLGEVLASGTVYVRNVACGDSPDAPAACIPMLVGDRVAGIIVIHRLLCHKERLTPLDHQLCAMLATHAGMALYASSLHARSKAEGVRQ